MYYGVWVSAILIALILFEIVQSHKQCFDALVSAVHIVKRIDKRPETRADVMSVIYAAEMRGVRKITSTTTEQGTGFTHVQRGKRSARLHRAGIVIKNYFSCRLCFLRSLPLSSLKLPSITPSSHMSSEQPSSCVCLIKPPPLLPPRERSTAGPVSYTWIARSRSESTSQLTALALSKPSSSSSSSSFCG